MGQTKRCTSPRSIRWDGRSPVRLHPRQFPGGTIAEQPYPHLLFQLVLSHSGWRYAEVTTGETFLALKQRLRNALWTLRGLPGSCVPTIPPPLTAATHELKGSRERTSNDDYAGLLDLYGLRSTRINSSRSHENGVADHAHYRLKDAVDQALIQPGSRDFHTAADYARFVQERVTKRNRLVRGKLEREAACLGPLPPASMPEYANYRFKVRRWSTIQVAGRSYSVSSRLIGNEAQVRLYADWAKVYYKGHFLERLERVRENGEVPLPHLTTLPEPNYTEGMWSC